jgi:hypothetical protein
MIFLGLHVGGGMFCDRLLVLNVVRLFVHVQQDKGKY